MRGTKLSAELFWNNNGDMSLDERLEKIRSSPRLQSQQQTAVVLSAVEDTLKDQKSERTPTAYFAALISLLSQYISSGRGIVNKDVAYAIVYLLDLVTPNVPPPLLRSKFSQILTSIAPALTSSDADAPLIRSCIGCLESLLVAQNVQGWNLPQSQVSPRAAVAGLLAIAVDHRPKVRKRAQEALASILKNPPPSPALDHPVADLCAETALRSLRDFSVTASQSKKGRNHQAQHHEPGLIHALQLIKTIATASSGWPSRNIDALCEVLLGISKSSNEYLTMAAFEVFETIIAGMGNEESSPKLPRLLEVLSDLKPSKSDSQLLPPWLAALSRGFDVSAQVEPEDTFQKLPSIFTIISQYLSSSSYNIRVSSSECLISFLVNCVPKGSVLEPSIYDEKILEKLASAVIDLLSVKYQAAWMEVFKVLEAALDSLRWRAFPLLATAVKTVGDLRGNDSFSGKKEADSVLGKAVEAMGPDKVLEIIPLNLAKPSPGQPGRAWLLPIFRDAVTNTYLATFRTEFVPLSEVMFQRVLNHGKSEKTMEIKIFETVVQQIWAIVPGFCTLPLDLTKAFDQDFAVLLSNLLYQQTELRTDICRGLEALVETNKSLRDAVEESEDFSLTRLSKADAVENLAHLAAFADNLLAVLFNIYSQTLPQYRGAILRCINSYLSIIPQNALVDTFNRVTSTLESSLADTGPQTQAEKQKQVSNESKMPPMSHTLMDLVITISAYLPRECYPPLFQMATVIINKDDDAQLQKKAYKLLPRLSESEVGKAALKERNIELQELLLSSAEKCSSPARRDRLAAISEIIEFIPSSDLHFIPSVLPEVVISSKEVNEKARTAAFDLLVAMGDKMSEGGTVFNSKVSHMPAEAPPVAASLEEYFTMVSAGLAGSTPHMVSASITAVTRILYNFHASVSEATLTNLLEIMDMFLENPNREIVRSVLGFVKVTVISLPAALMLRRLPALLPTLMSWSHEHKAHFRAKVKHILERMIRRFGADIVEKHTPEDDRKLIANIRKTRERRRRKKQAASAEDDAPDAADDPDDSPSEHTSQRQRRRGRFESEFDAAIYSSDSSSDAADADERELGAAPAARRGAGGGPGKSRSYIVEDDDEPLDLLDRRALGNISSTRPLPGARPSAGKKSRPKTDPDGKLILGDAADDDDVMTGADGEPGDGSLEGGINAYVAAIRGQDAARRGQRGKLKFSNRRGGAAGAAGGGGGNDEDGMELDEVEVAGKVRERMAARSPRGKGPGRGFAGGGRGAGGRGRGGRGGGGGFKAQRRGLGVPKMRSGGVVKEFRGGGIRR